MDDLVGLLAARALTNVSGEVLPDFARSTQISTIESSIDPLMIDLDYVDRDGLKSRRTVILQGISFDSEGASISAFCLAQRAHRTFLIKRIEAVITKNGEVLLASDYFFGRLGLSSDMQGLNFKTDLARGNTLPASARDLLGAKLGILIIAARIDGGLHPEELDRILVFAERELLSAKRAGLLQVEFNLDLMSAVETYIRNLYPMPRDISRYVEQVNKLPKVDRHKFWRAFCDLISADGRVSPEERKLVELVEVMQLRA